MGRRGCAGNSARPATYRRPNRGAGQAPDRKRHETPNRRADAGARRPARHGASARIRVPTGTRLAFDPTYNAVKRGKMVYEKIADYVGSVMPEVSTDQLKQAVESQNGGTATFVQSVPVHEEHGGQTVWHGTVTVFDLKGSPTGAFRAYAWSHELPGGKRRFFAVLHTPQIIGPREAVAAAIVAEHKAGK